MDFTIDKEIFNIFPGMKLAVVIVRNVDNNIEKPKINKELRRTWIGAGKAATEYGNPQSHPRVKAWVDHFKAIGVSRKKFPSSIESLTRRAGKGGEPILINPLVNFYNSVSLDYLVTAGGYDIDGLENGLDLRLSRNGDTFQALDDPMSSAVPVAEVSYADGSRILTRHFIWRQSKHCLIVPESKNVLLVSEIPGILVQDLLEDVIIALSEGIKKHFHVNPLTYIMDEKNPKIQIDKNR